ncbi:DEAD/DEAH box helicase [Natrinema hispanicum]|uniref:Superfamily II DNA or RNA helicase n=1 Tax=Natrinema hispanicum TaxID=392421 RepID=A0A1I0HMS1_9EURY|nr:DEAD/DEAH box helicase family protein [Natrinema hispanicum]RZV05160.1 superfamily II DNA or RNA helicase [Natrinema hispanicum]SET85274.1 Superfamily II DNA or RNA helicase [Natrinema hispanicum]
MSDIHKIADGFTDISSPGERFRDQWLDDLLRSQWPPYIDDTAYLVMQGIAIGETDLSTADFGGEVGRYYRRGLADSSDINLKKTSLPIGSMDSRDVGKIAWALKRLQTDIRTSNSANYRSTSRALEAVINKTMLEAAAAEDVSIRDFETIRLPEQASISDLMSELLCRPRSTAFVRTLNELANTSLKSGKSLLELLEEPRMVTPLWEHQRKAFSKWLDAGCRGFVDMATATGKTFLGLSAIAHHFGRLHPEDQDLTDKSITPPSTNPTVVIVAHRGIILDQWKREFDRHLNIPEDASAQEGAHTARYSWGTVHFWTPKRLLENDIPNTDLVILDEAHHYLGSSGFGSILDDIDNDVLALSGSIDERNAKSLERRNIPEIFEFTLEDGQEVGIIPQCTWNVELVPYEGQGRLKEVTQRCQRGFEQYQDGSAADDVSGVSEEDVSFETLREARSVVHTSAARSVMEQSEEFRSFSSGIKSRSLTKSNISPALTRIASLTLEHIEDNKCVVLLESGDEIETVKGYLRQKIDDETFEELVEIVATGDDDPLEAAERFDEEYDSGALIGTGTTLGEGVDIKTADVGINRASGQANRSLVQRIGRILRNPDGKGKATFYHVMGVPTNAEAMFAREDGMDLLETASRFIVWGESFDAHPWFNAEKNTVVDALATLEREGVRGIRELAPDHYEWPEDDKVEAQLRSLCEKFDPEDGSLLLSLEGDAFDKQDEPDSETKRGQIVAGNLNQPIEISKNVLSMLEKSNKESKEEEEVAIALRTALSEVEEPKVDDSVRDPSTITVELNPVLDGIVRTVAEDKGVEKGQIVEWAIEWACDREAV